MKRLSTLACSLLLLNIFSADAWSDTVINNNNYSASQPDDNPPPPPPTNGNANNSSAPDIQPGVYKTKNADGSSSTNYTTGTKKPYIVQNQSPTEQPVIQPYITPDGTGPTPGPGPGPGPRPPAPRK